MGKKMLVGIHIVRFVRVMKVSLWTFYLWNCPLMSSRGQSTKFLPKKGEMPLLFCLVSPRRKRFWRKRSKWFIHSIFDMPLGKWWLMIRDSLIIRWKPKTSSSMNLSLSYTKAISKRIGEGPLECQSHTSASSLTKIAAHKEMWSHKDSLLS